MSNETETLQGNWHELEVCWREMREGWNDPVSWRFEHEFWEPLSRAVEKMIRESEALSERLDQVHAEIDS